MKLKLNTWVLQRTTRFCESPFAVLACLLFDALLFSIYKISLSLSTLVNAAVVLITSVAKLSLSFIGNINLLQYLLGVTVIFNKTPLYPVRNKIK